MCSVSQLDGITIVSRYMVPPVCQRSVAPIQACSIGTKRVTVVVVLGKERGAQSVLGSHGGHAAKDARNDERGREERLRWKIDVGKSWIRGGSLGETSPSGFQGQRPRRQLGQCRNEVSGVV